ncbi:Uncharacterised protein [Mycobacteroides abscessus]|nr:Uncharacterised protein [Mycobacteroides abscessus]CQA11525.1 Uncharacterised protein [Mycobacteroides abscessus]
MFDILWRWAGRRGRQPGRRWSGCSTGAAIRTPHRATVGMGRRGAEGDSLTNRHRRNAGDRLCRTRSCTHTRHSVSSTAPVCRKRWRRRPRDWVSRRWPLPTTTVSMESSVSRKPPRNSACPPCSVRSYPLVVRAIPRSRYICWCWHAARRGIGGCRGRCPPRTCQEERPKTEKVSRASILMCSPRRPGGTGIS